MKWRRRVATQIMTGQRDDRTVREFGPPIGDPICRCMSGADARARRPRIASISELRSRHVEKGPLVSIKKGQVTGLKLRLDFCNS
jgi:hypothetical protein